MWLGRRRAAAAATLRARRALLLQPAPLGQSLGKTRVGSLRRFSSSESAGVRIYNSLSGKLEPLSVASSSSSINNNGSSDKAVDVAALRWYACGPTVYDRAHLGHARAYVSQDIVRRVLERRFGLRVLLVMGVTDVDDKIIARARENGEPFIALARREERAFFRDMAALHVLAPAAVVRVSEHMDDIIDYVARLERAGFAYAAHDGSGVYFDTRRLGDAYGKLDPSRCCGGEQQIEVDQGKPEDQEGDEEDQELGAKRDRRDFALWKAAKSENEPSWPAPAHWGSRGRPGWHIECSAMTHHVFGARLDVHSGGIDLRFPHHNNEIAQCDAHRLAEDADGDAADRWCGHFVHFGHLYIRGRKMSKSLKNFVSVREFLDEQGEAQGADLFRLFCLQHKYRANVVYSEDRVRDARAAVDRIRSFLRSLEALGCQQDPDHKKRCDVADMDVLRLVYDTRARFDEALRDDVDTPRALQLVLDLLARGHEYLVARPGLDAPAEVLGALAAFVLEVLELFGLVGLHSEFAPALQPLQLAGSMMGVGSTATTASATADAVTGTSDGDREIDEALLRALVQFRASVRQEALKNPRDPASAQILQLCDALRNSELPTLGVQVEDLSPGRAVYKKLTGAVQEDELTATLTASPTEDEDTVKQALREKQRAFEALMQIDPQDFLRVAPEFAGRFEDFDADGVPELDAQTREPLTKSQRKKLLKKRDKHAKSFTKYWEQQQSAGGPSGS